MNMKYQKTNVFVDLMMRNAHVGKSSKIYFGDHTLSLPCAGLTLKQTFDNEVGDILEIYYDELLKALIKIDTIIAVLSDEKETEMETLIKAVKKLDKDITINELEARKITKEINKL